MPTIDILPLITPALCWWLFDTSHSLLAGLGFVHTLRYDSLPGFLGLRQET